MELLPGDFDKDRSTSHFYPEHYLDGLAVSAVLWPPGGWRSFSVTSGGLSAAGRHDPSTNRHAAGEPMGLFLLLFSCDSIELQPDRYVAATHPVHVLVFCCFFGGFWACSCGCLVSLCRRVLESTERVHAVILDVVVVVGPVAARDRLGRAVGRQPHAGAMTSTSI